MLLKGCKDTQVALHAAIVVITNVIGDHLDQFLFAGKTLPVVTLDQIKKVQTAPLLPPFGVYNQKTECGFSNFFKLFPNFETKLHFLEC